MIDECGVALGMSEVLVLALMRLRTTAYFICLRCSLRCVERPQSPTSTLQWCRPDGLACSQQIDVDVTDTHYLLNRMYLARSRHQV
jgi:hypothetical protein